MLSADRPIGGHQIVVNPEANLTVLGVLTSPIKTLNDLADQINENVLIPYCGKTIGARLDGYAVAIVLVVPHASIGFFDRLNMGCSILCRSSLSAQSRIS